MKKIHNIKYIKYLLSTYGKMAKNLIIDEDGDLCRVHTGGETASVEKIATFYRILR